MRAPLRAIQIYRTRLTLTSPFVKTGGVIRLGRARPPGTPNEIPSKPRRQLGLFDAIMIVMGGIVGAGIFANPSEVAHRVHTPFLILGVWVLGGLFAMCGAFIWAELAMRLPAAEGGQYVYLREAYHPAVGFVCFSAIAVISPRTFARSQA